MKKGKCTIIVRELEMISTEFGDQITEVSLNDIKLLYKDFNIDSESAKVQVSGSKTFLVMEATNKTEPRQTQQNLQILPVNRRW